MILLFQLTAMLIAVTLDFGPLGRQLSPWLSLSSGLVFVWAFSWFGRSEEAFRFAILQSLAFTLVSFLNPVAWLVRKARFFEVSSVFLALLTLGLASIWESVVLGLFVRSFDPLTIVGHVLANVVHQS